MRTRREENKARVEQFLAHQAEPLSQHPGACGFLVLELHEQASAKLLVRRVSNVPE
uniref:Uncharacterized protein n=1 Tax=Arundo donax TaxID=35708 RepID=A0A0A8ZKY1_ARUDO